MLSSMFGGKKKKKATKSRASTSSTGAKGKKKKQAAPVTRTKRVTKSLAFTDSADDDDDDDDAASITKSIGGRSTASKSRGKKMEQKKQLPSPSPAPPLQSKSLAGVPPREQTPQRVRTKGDRELGRSKARLPRRGSDDDGESKGVDVGRSKRVASGRKYHRTRVSFAPTRRLSHAARTRRIVCSGQVVEREEGLKQHSTVALLAQGAGLWRASCWFTGPGHRCRRHPIRVA